MIVGMKKVTILAGAKHREAVTSQLKDLGIVHVHLLAAPVSTEIQEIEREKERLERALSILGEEGSGEITVFSLTESAVVERILDLAAQRDQAIRQLEEREAQDRWYSIWGAVSLESVRFLRRHGIHVRFYVMPKKIFAVMAEERILQVVREEGGYVFCALISRDADERLDVREDPIPDLEHAVFVRERKECNRVRDEATRELDALKPECCRLLEYREVLEKRLAHHHVRDGMAEQDAIVSLEGFCPVDRIDAFRAAADAHGWAYVIAAPDDPDVTPTLIRNSKLVEIISPVFKFMGTVPGYGEFDVSIWFLIFLSIFFALLVGDAAYGLIFLSITGFVQWKFKDVPRQPLHLVYLFGGATVIWGAVTGTWFGYAPIARLPGFSALVINRLDSFVDENQFFMIMLCFTIGVIHLTIAHLVAGFRVINSLQVLSQVGWIFTVWAGYFIAGFLVIGRPMPGITIPFLATGILLSLIFTNIGFGLWRGISRTILELPFGVINSFGDVVSYIRLFAVGMATVVVAKSFNDMCIELGSGSLLAGMAAAVALFVGHVINIVLALMSVMVHGIRLNMLEFSGHLGMQWSGREYRPFKE